MGTDEDKRGKALGPLIAQGKKTWKSLALSSKVAAGCVSALLVRCLALPRALTT